MDLYQYELIAYDQGFSAVCGIDEAGRGPLAGEDRKSTRLNSSHRL